MLYKQVVHMAKKEIITEETVRKVAAVSRLNLTEKEEKKFRKDLNEILSAFSELDKIKTKEKPSFQPIEVKDITRKDEKEQCLTHDDAFANAKHKERGFFKGPKVN